MESLACSPFLQSCSSSDPLFHHRCFPPKIARFAPLQSIARDIIPKLGSETSTKSTMGSETSTKSTSSDKFESTHNPKHDRKEHCLLALDQSSVAEVVRVIAAAVLVVEKQKRVQEQQQARRQVPIDALQKGRLVEKGRVYRQMFVIRSYEVGFDRSASIDTLANLFQETALNHVGMADFVGDGMGTTHAMMRHKLIWVVTRMHIQVSQYPVWGDVVEIDSWVSGSGKNGMRRDFLVRDYLTGQIRARATSNWAMMDQDTRRLSKMPDDVRAEISPHFLDRCVMACEPWQRIHKLDDSAPYIEIGLVPLLHDMDMNQHVNHVKYINWVLESVPQSLLVAYELMGMTLEYRKECKHSDVVSSLTLPESPLSPCIDESFELSSTGHAQVGPPSIKCPHITTVGPVCYMHLLRLQDDGTEILRGRTQWKLKERFS